MYVYIIHIALLSWSGFILKINNLCRVMKFALTIGKCHWHHCVKSQIKTVLDNHQENLF